MCCGLADRDEQLLSRLIFPAIAHREREALADIVELKLIDQLHVRREADDEIGRYLMDLQQSGRKIDIGVDVARDDLKQGAQTNIGFKIGLEIIPVVKTA